MNMQLDMGVKLNRGRCGRLAPDSDLDLDLDLDQDLDLDLNFGLILDWRRDWPRIPTRILIKPRFCAWI